MLRWAILGTGFISNTFIEAIALSDGSTAAVMAGRNADKVADFQQRHSIARGLSYDEAVADSDIDAVYIGLPNHQHHPYAISAAAAGKAVLCEKSLTTTMQSAHELATAVDQRGTFFAEGLMYLSHPLYVAVAGVLRDGRLGSLRTITARYGAKIDHLVNPLGRGTIYNLGCYPVSLVQFVVQAMCGEDVFATHALSGAGNVNAKDGTVCDAALAMRFDNGVLATVQSSDTHGMVSEFSIAGDQGVFRFVTNPWLPVGGDNIISWEPYEGPGEQIVVHDDHDAFYHQVKMVERHITAGDREPARPSPRLRDSLEIMQVLTAWESLCLAK